MDHNSIIDRETFEVTLHAEDHPKVIVCDKPIAPTISILNKKGYKTIASCSGHYRNEYWEYYNQNLKDLEEAKNNDRIIIKKINEDSFDYWLEVDGTLVYILFDKGYKFNNLPDGFKIDEEFYKENNRTSIECEINYYDEKSERKTMMQVMNELDNKYKLLEKWAENLPDIKERND